MVKEMSLSVNSIMDPRERGCSYSKLTHVERDS